MVNVRAQTWIRAASRGGEIALGDTAHDGTHGGDRIGGWRMLGSSNSTGRSLVGQMRLHAEPQRQRITLVVAA